MKKKLSNQFLTNYLVVLLLTAIVMVFALLLLSSASSLISARLTKNRYPASSIMRDDYTQIDASSVTQNGGGVQIINHEYQVVFSDGLDTIGKRQLSAAEWTEFLMRSKSKGIPYFYDIIYNQKGRFWLVVTFPTSLRIDFDIVSNKAAAPGDIFLAIGVLVAVFVIFTFLLSLITFAYSRVTASRITKPLQKLCDGTRLLREGDYSVRVELHLKNEFAELQDTFNDMASRIEHEMALRKKSENDRRQLILDISHDLKNPLASVTGYTELCLKKPELTTEERNAYLQVVYNNGQRANRLLTELFELSKLDNPEFALKLVKTDLCEYLRQVCGDLLPSLEGAGFQYEFSIPEKSIYVEIDPDRLSRVFQNLADNAIRYNQKGTTVSVSLYEEGENEEGGKAVILFQDDGCGIPAHLADDVFKPFVRADSSRNSEAGGGGSGLGLAIAKKLAIAHGGDLTLSTDVDKGCTFVITLPII